jgi:hypothetical protein
VGNSVGNDYTILLSSCILQCQNRVGRSDIAERSPVVPQESRRSDRALSSEEHTCLMPNETAYILN